MYCRYCGKENSDQAMYCSGCGQELTGHTGSSSNDSDTELVPKGSSNNGKKKRNQLLVVILLIAAILAGAIFVVPGLTAKSEPEEPDAEVWQVDDNMSIMNAGFTDRQITEESSAVLAAQDVSDEMGYENAFDELTPYLSTTVDGESYYRLQEYYQGIPVYQRYTTVVASAQGKPRGLYADAVDIDDDISLTPTLTEAEARSAITTYAQSLGEEISNDFTLSEMTDDALIIYSLDESKPACLAYQLNVDDGCYSVILDAQTGEVLDRSSNISGAGKENEADSSENTWKYYEKNGKYILGDSERKFYIHNLNLTHPLDKKGYFDSKVLKNASELTSEDETLNSVDGHAITIMTNFCKIADFYETVGQEFPLKKLKKIDIYYNGAFWKEKDGETVEHGNYAAGGKTAEQFGNGILLMGYEYSGLETSTIAHEFMHIIQNDLNATIGTGSDDGIVEGIADAFSCFYGVKSKEYNWIIDARNGGGGVRNAAVPSLHQYPTTITDQGDWPETDDHAYATVISHAAYLMYQSGEFSSIKDLAKLWYNTLLTLPANCSYQDLAYSMYNIVTNTDEDGNTKYSIGQVAAVYNAFEEVGIYIYLRMNNDINLYTYKKSQDANNFSERLYDNYTVEISKVTGMKTYQASSHALDDAFSHTIDMDTTGPCKLKLSNGLYQIKVIDNGVYTGEMEQTYYVNVCDKYDKSALKFYGFGVQYIVSPDATVKVFDANSNEVKYSIAEVKADQTVESSDVKMTYYLDAYLVNGILDVSEYNYYDLTVKIPYKRIKTQGVSPNNNTYYEISQTVWVKRGGADELRINLPFVCVSEEEEETREEAEEIQEEIVEETESIEEPEIQEETEAEATTEKRETTKKEGKTEPQVEVSGNSKGTASKNTEEEQPDQVVFADAGDFEISEITYMGDYMTQEAYEQGLPYASEIETEPYSCASVTLTNTQNEVYAANVSFRYKISEETADGIQDKYGNDTYTYYFAPYETKQVYGYLAKTTNGIDGYSYTGEWEVTAATTIDGVLPVTAVSLTGFENDKHNEVYADFSIENTTEDIWTGCTVNYDVFYQGMYAGSFKASGNTTVEPGETAEVSQDLNNLPMYGYVTAFGPMDLESIENNVKINVTGVRYSYNH